MPHDTSSASKNLQSQPSAYADKDGTNMAPPAAIIDESSKFFTSTACGPAPMKPPASKVQWFPIITVLSYTLLGVIGLINHEPWRDEAQAWLIARDLDLLGIFKQMSYEGHLPLWHILLFPFAQAGVSYLSEFIIHLGLAIVAVAVFVWHAPFSKTTKILFVFSYYMAYEYSIVARNYNISILLLFLIAACYGARFKHPLKYSLLIFLLFNTNVHSLAMAGSLATLFSWELLKNKEKNKKALFSFMVMWLGFVLAIIQLLPSPDNMFYGFVFKPFSLVTALKGAFFVDTKPDEVYGFAAFLVFVLVLLSMSEKPAALFVALTSCLGLFSIFIFKYPGFLRHHALILIFLIFSLWISKYYQRLDKGISNINLDKILTIGTVNLPIFMLNICLFISVIFCVRIHPQEYRYCFSGAKEMAMFIAKNKLEAHIIIAHRSPQASALLPYLPGKKFWYADIKDYGTYITWNQNYKKNAWIDDAEVIARMRAAFPNNSNLLLLLNQALNKPEGEDFKLIYATECMPFGSGREKYFLYKQMER